MTPAERERAYSPSSCLPGGDYLPFVEAYVARSGDAQTASRALGATWRVQPIGDGALPAIALCLPRHKPGVDPAMPLLVFIHGGYWQELSANDSLFAAATCAARGVAFAAMDYTLAPKATVTHIVHECRRALAWCVSQAPTLGIDTARVVVAGSSAGAHLAAMVSLKDAAVPGWRPRSAVLVSGVYELEPLVGTSINDALGMDIDQARTLSPASQPLQGFAADAVVCWGEVETTAFKEQSKDFATRLERAGVRSETFEVPGRNHFDVILDLADPQSRLGQATLGRLGVR